MNENQSKLFQSNQYLSEILEKDALAGSFIYSKGFKFNSFQKLKVSDFCESMNMSIHKIEEEFKIWNELKHLPDLSELKNLPLDFLISFLRNAHEKFLWQKLPYMQEVIDSINPLEYKNPELLVDMKIIFPIFTEDFIHHIHEEEDTLFAYALDLYKADKRGMNPAKLFNSSSRICLFDMAEHHLDDDDEMEGIRRLTNNYHLDDNEKLNLKVIYSELMDFEKELQKHASIENDILFPKAIILEKKLKNKIRRLSYLN